MKNDVETRLQNVFTTFLASAVENGFISQGVNDVTGYAGHLSYTLIDAEFARDPKNRVQLSDINTQISEKIDDALETKRSRYRKREELPDPTKPASARVNRRPSKFVQVKVELEPTEVDRIEEFRKASGKTKKEIMQEALALYFETREP